MTWLGNLGLAYYSLSQYKKTIDYQSQALAVFDDVWAGLKTDDRRITFADQEYMICARSLQQAHVALGQPALALECAERARGRAFELRLAQQRHRRGMYVHIC